MYILLHFFLKHSGAGRFVKVCDFKNMSGIDPIIDSSSHHIVFADEKFVHRRLEIVSETWRSNKPQSQLLTLL